MAAVKSTANRRSCAIDLIVADAGTPPVTAPTACTIYRSPDTKERILLPLSPEAMDSDLIFQIQPWKSNLRNIWAFSC